MATDTIPELLHLIRTLPRCRKLTHVHSAFKYKVILTRRGSVEVKYTAGQGDAAKADALRELYTLVAQLTLD